MRKISMILLIFCLLNTLTACSKNAQDIQYDVFVDVDNALKMPDANDNFSFDEATFIYDNIKYDLSEREPLINAINGYVKAGNYLIISCHTGPKNSVYCIFDTTTHEFSDDIIGNNLIFYNDDIKTGVYSFWSDVFDYDGKLIQTIKLQESEYINKLAFINGYKEIEVSISDYNKENSHTEIIPIGR